MKPHVLLVEDEPGITMILTDRLDLEGYEVDTAEDGDTGLQKALNGKYDLIVLDVMLPKKSGFEVCRTLRQNNIMTPVLMLTARGNVVDKVTGLQIGADDYLTKPFHMKELGARVRALLRRPAAVNSNVLEAGNITIDTAKYRVTVNGEPMTLVPREFQLLEFFMRHPNQVFSPEALLNRVWPSDSEATTEALRTALKRLRKKVDPDGNLLRTVHGVGYILEVS